MAAKTVYVLVYMKLMISRMSFGQDWSIFQERSTFWWACLSAWCYNGLKGAILLVQHRQGAHLACLA